MRNRRDKRSTTDILTSRGHSHRRELAARIITTSFFQIVCQQFQDQIGERARVHQPEFAAGPGTNFYTAWRDIAEKRARRAGWGTPRYPRQLRAKAAIASSRVAS
jgi:hypothetical protein